MATRNFWSRALEAAAFCMGVCLFAGALGVPVVSEVLAAPVTENSDANFPADQLLTGDARWGCELLLCLANPNGWKSVSECRPPVEKYIKCSTRKHNKCSMPKCKQAGPGNDAYRNDDVYDPCPLLGEGYQEAPTGFLYSGQMPSGSGWRGPTLGRGSSTYNYNGEREDCDSDGNCTTYSSKACVKPDNYLGTAREPYTCYDDDGDRRTCYRTVKVYSEIKWQKEQSRRAIDVIIEGKLYNRVHY